MKRILCVLLAVLLLAGMLPAAAPAADAAANPGFQALSQYLRENGEHAYSFGTESYSLSLERSMWSSGSASCSARVMLEYFPDSNTIEVLSSLYLRAGIHMFDPYYFHLLINSDGSFSNVYCSCVNGEAHYSLTPASFTRTTILKAYEYLEGGESHARLDNAASTLLKETLEAFQLILKQKSRSVADLGFNKYQTGHTHSWNGGSVVLTPNCGRLGEKEYVCSGCKSIALEILNTVGNHSWDSGTVTQQPSCTEEGTFVRTCTKCGDRQETTLPALGHAWTLTQAQIDPMEPDKLHLGIGLYTCSRCGVTTEDRVCASVVFSDMPPEGNWAHAPIDWAWYNGITAGKGEGTFAPKDTVTRAEVMTFLWVTLHRPEPATTDNPFTDVPAGKYFYKPVLWAVEHGVTSGTSETTFGPGELCTRGQIVTFLWVAAGKPEPTTTENPFADVPEGKYFYKPVLWAVENNITGGTSETTFEPNASCNRAQVVTFLYKAEAILNTPQPEPEPETP